jgi:hypothetical protein
MEVQLETGKKKGEESQETMVAHLAHVLVKQKAESFTLFQGILNSR